MPKKNEEILSLLEKRSNLEKQLAQVNKELIKEYINQFVQYHAIDFKENDVPLPHSVHISFEDVYDDEGGYDTQLDNVHFYDEDQSLLELDFIIEIEGSSYDEEFIYAVREIIMDNFDLDDLANCLGEDFNIQLR